MRREEWERAQLLFETVAALGSQAREAALNDLHAEDPDLAATVLGLLRADAKASILDASLTDLAEAALQHDHVGSLVEAQIGPYRLSRVLGEGGMGIVYLAERLHIGGHVAIKLLRDAWISPMRRDRFRLEQQTLARLNHPCIAQIHDAGTLHGDTPWFVMEYVDGIPLTAWARERCAGIADRLALIKQVAGAVACAHSLALVHRDLKPSNILVTPGGEVKLLDFGIVKDLSDAADGHTIDGLRLLTPGYAAPEQREGGIVGLFTDVYGLGVLLYELLTGGLPLTDVDGFSGKPSRAARLGPEKNLQLTRAQWNDLDAICVRALQPDPVRRYSSAAAFLQDIEAFEQGRVVTARPAGTWYSVSKFARRNRLVLAVAAVAALLLTATATIAALRVTRSRDLALHQLSRMARLRRFTEDLFDGGTPEQGRSAQVTTDMLLRRGELQAEGLHDDLELQSAMFATLGGIWQHLGDLAHADVLLRRALEERDPARHNFSPETDSRALYVTSLVDLGLLRLDQRRMDEAETLLHRAVSLAPKRGPLTPEAARALGALGDVLATHGKYPEAQTVLEQMIASEERSGNADTQQFADGLARLADVHLYKADFDQAIALDRQALGIYQRTIGDNHPSVAHVTNSLGHMARDQGHMVEAENDFRRSLTLDQSWYGPENATVADDYVGLAQVFASTERDGEAKVALEHALEIQKHVHGSRHSAVAVVLNQLGVLADSHDREDEAEIDFREALSIWREVYGEDHQFIGLCYSNLAGVYMSRKDYPHAEGMARRALSNYQKSLPPNHPSTAVIHVKLGRILLREGRLSEAEPETRMGYEFFRTHESTDSTYLKGARKDLETIANAQTHNASYKKSF